MITLALHRSDLPNEVYLDAQLEDLIPLFRYAFMAGHARHQTWEAYAEEHLPNQIFSSAGQVRMLPSPFEELEPVDEGY